MKTRTEDRGLRTDWEDMVEEVAGVLRRVLPTMDDAARVMEAFSPRAVTKPGSELAGDGGGGVNLDRASAVRRLMESLLSLGAAGAAVGGAGAREGDGDSAFAYGVCEEEGCERCRRLVEGQRMEDIAVYGLLIGAGVALMASVLQAAVRGVW